MCINRRVGLLAFAGALLAAHGNTVAADKAWRASVAQLPVVSENAERGALIDIVKAIENSSGQKIQIGVEPFARSVDSAIEGRSDFHLPLLQKQGSKNPGPKFDYSSEVLYQVNFVLYTRKDSKLDVKNLAGAKIETDIAHTGFFDFPTVGSSDLALSLKKVDAGRIDGFIFADINSDAVVKANGLKNIKRQLFSVVDVKFVLPKGGSGGVADQFLSANIKKLKATGEWTKVVAPLAVPYDDWQP